MVSDYFQEMMGANNKSRSDTIPYLTVYTPSPCKGKQRKPKYMIPHKMKEFLRIYERD